MLDKVGGGEATRQSIIPLALILVLVVSSVLGVAASPRPWLEEKYSVSRTGSIWVTGAGMEEE